MSIEGKEDKVKVARRARLRKIRRKLARLRKIRERIAMLKESRPPRWQARVAHWEKVAGRVRRELKRLGWKPAKKKSSDPLEETEEQDKDEQLDEPAEKADPEDADVPEEGGNDANEDGLGGCRCQHPNWIHGDEAGPGGKINLRARIAQAAEALKSGRWLAQPIAVGTQGRLHTRPGQRALVMDVAPGLHLVQYVPSNAVPKTSALGDEVGILPLLLVPGMAKKVGTLFQRTQEPQPGQLGHPATPLVPRPPGEADPIGDDLSGRRRRRPRRPRREEEEDEEEEDTAPVRRRRARRGGGR